jgi:aldose sugar dehydrogenase
LPLDLPAEGLKHPGCKRVLGKDHSLYVVIYELNRQGQLQFLKTDQFEIYFGHIKNKSCDGPNLWKQPIYNNHDSIMHPHYAYGIRDSLGASTDPMTGSLCNKENGDKGYNEINIVNPGFNSGWKKI